MGITSGEIIVPTFTFISTSNAVILAGAKPVFAESESETYGLDAEDVNERITKKTKAIIPIHYGGLASRDIKILKEIADDNKIKLIEDAAESIGSKIDNINVGTFGTASMFSFCQNKVITTGEGGVIVTNSKQIYEKLKLIRSHGRVESKEADYFSSTDSPDYIQIGYNFRMPTLSAALGLSQFSKINKIINLRRENANHLNKNLSSISNITLPLEGKNKFHVYQMYTIQVDKEIRDGLQNHLSDKGIMTKVYFDPIHLKSFYKKEFKYNNGDLPKTEELSKRVLTLPMYPNMEKSELEYIEKSIKEFI